MASQPGLHLNERKTAEESFEHASAPLPEPELDLLKAVPARSRDSKQIYFHTAADGVSIRSEVLSCNQFGRLYLVYDNHEVVELRCAEGLSDEMLLSCASDDRYFLTHASALPRTVTIGEPYIAAGDAYPRLCSPVRQVLFVFPPAVAQQLYDKLAPHDAAWADSVRQDDVAARIPEAFYAAKSNARAGRPSTELLLREAAKVIPAEFPMGRRDLVENDYLAGVKREGLIFYQFAEQAYKALRHPRDSRFKLAAGETPGDEQRGAAIGKNKERMPHDPQIAAYTALETPSICVEKGAWHRRTPAHLTDGLHPRGKADNEAMDRISFSGIADKALVDYLDDYVATRRLACYKVPDCAGGWLDRHDPVTIYFYEPITEEVKQELKNDLAKFSREKWAKAELIGERFAPGLAHDKECLPSECTEILNRIDQLNPLAGTTISARWRHDPSTGMRHVLLELAALLEKMNEVDGRAC